MAVTSSGTATVTLPNDEQILITRGFDAPKHLVYKAWTTPELIKRWWSGNRGETMIAEIDLRVGGAWRCVMVTDGGLEVAFHGEYREIVPNRSPWALLPLTAALAPVLFLGAAVVALAISISLYALLEGGTVAPTGPPEPPPRVERTGAEAPPEGTGLTTAPGRTSRTATASPTASPAASPAASPKASPSAPPSASAGARTPR